MGQKGRSTTVRIVENSSKTSRKGLGGSSVAVWDTGAGSFESSKELDTPKFCWDTRNFIHLHESTKTEAEAARDGCVG